MDKWEINQWYSATVYQAAVDPNRGKRPAMVGISFKPTPSLTVGELRNLISHLEGLASKMDASNWQP